MWFVVKDGGFLIEKKVLFWSDGLNADYINLGMQEGDAMLYDKSLHILIDYPGEYDVQDMFIKAFVDKTGKLNYIITEWNTSFAIVQSPRALDEEEISEAATIYYTDDTVEKMLDKLEIEAHREKLMQEVPTIS
jgi:hypothetical protein